MSEICVIPTLNTIRKECLPDLQNIYDSNGVSGVGRLIYFGSIDGYSITYPAYKDPRGENTCNKNDPRTR